MPLLLPSVSAELWCLLQNPISTQWFIYSWHPKPYHWQREIWNPWESWTLLIFPFCWWILENNRNNSASSITLLGLWWLAWQPLTTPLRADFNHNLLHFQEYCLDAPWYTFSKSSAQKKAFWVSHKPREERRGNVVNSHFIGKGTWILKIHGPWQKIVST